MFELADKKTKETRMDTCKACSHSNITSLLGLTCGPFAVKTEHTCGCKITALIQFVNSKCKSNKWN